LTAIGWKFPRASGPNIRVSLILIEPCSNVPETTVPTPCQIQKLLYNIFSLGNFQPIAVKSIHRKRMPVKEVKGGQTASFALKKVTIQLVWLVYGV
jgi:hypothetical protein